MWEERWHPLREEWVIVAAHRQARPWSGAEVAAPTPATSGIRSRPATSVRATRGSAARSTRATRGAYVFDNDHPCVGAAAPRELAPPAGIYRNRPATGVARVVCYSPRHDVTLAELEVDASTRCCDVADNRCASWPRIPK